MRESPSQDWQFICYSISKENGWRFAAVIQQQERFLFGNRRARAIVSDRASYDDGKVKEIHPPADWKSGLMSDKEYEETIRNVGTKNTQPKEPDTIIQQGIP